MVRQTGGFWWHFPRAPNQCSLQQTTSVRAVRARVHRSYTAASQIPVDALVTAWLLPGHCRLTHSADQLSTTRIATGLTSSHRARLQTSSLRADFSWISCGFCQWTHAPPETTQENTRGAPSSCCHGYLKDFVVCLGC